MRALSRVELSTCFAISHPAALWLDELRQYFKHDVNGKQLVDQVLQNSVNFPNYSYRDGIIYRNGKIMVPPLQSFRNKLLEEYHSSVIGAIPMSRLQRRESQLRVLGWV